MSSSWKEPGSSSFSIALAGRVLALGVLLLDRRLGSVVDGGVAQLLELGELLLVGLWALLAHGAPQVIRRGPRRCSSRAPRADWRSIQICWRSSMSAAAEHLVGERLAHLARLGEDPALLGQRGHARRGAGDGVRRRQDAALGGFGGHPSEAYERENGRWCAAPSVSSTPVRAATACSVADRRLRLRRRALARARPRRARDRRGGGTGAPRTRDALHDRFGRAPVRALARARVGCSRLGGQRDPRAPARGLEPHAPGGSVALPFDDRLRLRAGDADLAELTEMARQRSGVGDLRPQLRGRLDEGALRFERRHRLLGSTSPPASPARSFDGELTDPPSYDDARVGVDWKGQGCAGPGRARSRC